MFVGLGLRVTGLHYLLHQDSVLVDQLLDGLIHLFNHILRLQYLLINNYNFVSGNFKLIGIERADVTSTISDIHLLHKI